MHYMEADFRVRRVVEQILLLKIRRFLSFSDKALLRFDHFALISISSDFEQG